MSKNFENLILYHNNKCSKSREVKKYLDSNDINYELIDYLNKPIDKKLLNKVLLNLKNDFKEIIRTNEKIFKSLDKNEKLLKHENILNLISKYPKLMQRPVIAKQENQQITAALICRPPELVNNFLNEN
tara:strand:+ start:78 stop:464 length:387 start_codon:yes stop_codon:yes gene_type:complete